MIRRLALLLPAATLTLLISLTGSQPAHAAYPGANGKVTWLSPTEPSGHGTWDIWTMNPDGTNPTNLVPGGVDEEYPAWSPDGRRIAFARTSGTPSGCFLGDIYVMDADGSNVTQLTTNPLGNAATQPTWSPDGTKIAYTQGRQDSTCNDGDSEIWVMNDDGTGQTAITSGGIGIYNGDGEPAWSPDGTRIAFTGHRGAAGNQLFGIFTINPDGSGLTRLTGDPISFIRTYSPAWSPDGQRIAYERNDGWDGSDEIWIMNADGSGHTAVTRNGFLTNWSPAWSPDVRQIAFSGQDDLTTFDNEIFVINVDGTGQTAITNNTTGDSYPDWQPLVTTAPENTVNVVDTFAGDSTIGFGGDGGSALAAQLSDPHGIAVAPDGTVYFADSGNFRIRKIDPAGIISTIAGTGVSGNTGDGGPATSATLSFLLTISLDPTSNTLYVADVNNNRVRSIDLNTGTITRFAGGLSGFAGDGGLATNARLRRPQGVSVAPDGSVVIADTNNCRIRKVSAGIITTIAGSGVCESTGNGLTAGSVAFYFPRRVHVDGNGNIFVADGSLSNEDDTVRRIDAVSNIVEGVAGGGTVTPGSGAAVDMDIGNVSDVLTDQLGDLYIGSLHRVFRVDLGSGVLSPFAGTGDFGYSGDGGNALDAQFFGVNAVALLGDTLLISDGGNARIRAVTPTAPASDDVVVTDCADPELAGLTVVAGDLIVDGVPGCEAVSFPNLVEVSGNLEISDNNVSGSIDLSNVATVGGTVNVSGNTAAGDLDLGSLGTAGGSVSVTGNTASGLLDLASLATVSGDLTVSGNTASGDLDLGQLTSVDNVQVNGNTPSGVLDIGSLTEADSVEVSGNTVSGVLDLGSLGTVSGDLTVTENGDATVNLAALTTVGGDLTLDTTGSGNLDLSGADVSGDLSLTAIAADTVSATTAGGSTEVTVLGGTAAMRVLLPDGTFEQPVAFRIERQADGPVEDGTTAAGAAAAIDPLGGYRFTFAVPTLNQQAQLSFTVDLAQLDAETRAALLAGITDGSATLVVKRDEAGAAYQAFARCTGTQTPQTDGCVAVIPLSLTGGPPAPGAEPAFVRFEGVAGSFSTWAVALVTPTDSTPPVITPTVSGTLGSYGWYTSDVVVSWAVEDPESAITGQSGCGPQTVSADTAGVTFTCEATSAGGTASRSVTIKRDATAPTITGSRDPAANASGWNNGDVTVSFTCADALSGIASCSAPSTITTEGADQSVTGTATDVAGNQATATVGGIDIDKTAPSCSANASPNTLWPPDHKLVTVDVSVAISDSLSGAAGYTLLSVTSNEPDDGEDDGNTVNDIQGFDLGTPDTTGKLRAERSGVGSGRIYTLTYQVTDLAGNSATCSAQVTVPRD